MNFYISDNQAIHVKIHCIGQFKCLHHSEDYDFFPYHVHLSQATQTFFKATKITQYIDSGTPIQKSEVLQNLILFNINKKSLVGPSKRKR